MQVLTELAMAKAPRGIFTRHEAAQWLGGSRYRQRRLFAEAMAGGELLRIRRGLYCVAPHLLPNKVNPLTLAHRIHEPSYISLEMAMSYHGMIPEAVCTITSVSQVRSRELATPFGISALRVFLKGRSMLRYPASRPKTEAGSCSHPR